MPQEINVRQSMVIHVRVDIFTTVRWMYARKPLSVLMVLTIRPPTGASKTRVPSALPDILITVRSVCVWPMLHAEMEDRLTLPETSARWHTPPLAQADIPIILQEISARLIRHVRAGPAIIRLTMSA